MKVKRQNGILFLAFRPFPALVGLKIRARSVKKVGVCRVPFHLVFSFHLIYPIGQKCFVIISPGARFAYLMNAQNATKPTFSV